MKSGKVEVLTERYEGKRYNSPNDVVVDPAALDKLSEQRAVETARGAVVDVLDARLLAQLGVAQASGEPFVVPQRGFTFEQQSKPFGVTEA